MKSRRQRVWLTAMAVAGSVALYGCGGGSDGPDTTPYDQDYVDDAIDAAKKAEEDRQAAIATATEAANEAATAASDAATAEKDAKDAAAAATIAATYETLDADEAEAQSTAAANAKAAADTALAAANDALAKANAVNHSDQAVTDLKTAAQSSASAADASAKAAAGFATEAKTQADIARATQTGIDNDRLAAQEQGVQRRLAANKAGDADAAAKTAAEKATEAEAEAEDALPAAKAAQDALASDATDAEKAAAQKAVDDAEKRDADYNTRATTASEAADAAEAAEGAAMTAATEAADAAAAAGDTDPASEGAMSAAEAAASYLAARISANVARGWSDVLAITKTYKDTDATEASLDDLLARIPWATDQDREAGALSALLAGAHHAAERLAEQEDPDSGGTKGYQEDISSRLTAVTTDATNIADALSAARDAHNAAKPWSENGRAVDDLTGAAGETVATGAILINEDGRINLGGNAEDLPATTEKNERINVVFDVTQSTTLKGPHDALRNDKGIVSFSSGTGQGYQLVQNNRYGTGTDKLYDHLTYGVWSGVTLPTEAQSGPIDATNGNPGGGGAFALLDDDAPATSVDLIGTATFTGDHVTVVVTTSVPASDGTTTSTNTITEGDATASVNFGSDESSLTFKDGSDDWYKIEELKLSGNMLTGGKYTAVGRGAPIGATGGAGVPSVHVGLFGDKAQEIGGTVSVTDSARDNANTTPTITVNTAFGARNDAHGGL